MFCGRQKLLFPSLLADNILQIGGYFCRGELCSPVEGCCKPVGATIGRPPKLWLNHNFDIYFLYGKPLVVCLNPTGEHSSPLQKQYIRFALIKIAERRKAAIHNAYKIFYGGLYD